MFAATCILYTYFEGSPVEEADKIRKKIKKFLMFISSPTNIRVTWEQAWLVGSAM
jgi:hypothetical protein